MHGSNATLSLTAAGPSDHTKRAVGALAAVVIAATLNVTSAAPAGAKAQVPTVSTPPGLSSFSKEYLRRLGVADFSWLRRHSSPIAGDLSLFTRKYVRSLDFQRYTIDVKKCRAVPATRYAGLYTGKLVAVRDCTATRRRATPSGPTIDTMSIAFGMTNRRGTWKTIYMYSEYLELN